MLNASHVRTKRAAFSEDSMSRTPANAIGWLPTTPTVMPSRRAKPHVMLVAQCWKYSKYSPLSTTSRMTFFMSYGWFGETGRMSRKRSHERSASSLGSSDGGSSRLFCGKNDIKKRTSSKHACSSAETNVATPLFDAWLIAPPSSSNVTSSPVTVFTTSGPVMNMWLDSRTMKMKSVIAGEYTAPPAHGPRMTEICGITPEACTLRWKMPPYDANDTTPS